MRPSPRFGALFATSFALGAALWQGGDPRLTARLDPQTREQVSVIITAARKEGVPTETLIDRALEGASKRAPGTVIVSVVRTWADDLRKSRGALGPASSDAEVVAGAYAIRNGVSIKELERLRAARSGVRYAVALDVMNYLVSKGVPADTISNVIVNLVLASASDAQFMTLRSDVERDLTGGIAAGTAATLRGSGMERQLAEAASAANGGTPGSALPSGRGSSRIADPMLNPQAVGAAQGAANVSGASGDGARPAGPRGKPKQRP
jgi:hypothetical protein